MNWRSILTLCPLVCGLMLLTVTANAQQEELSDDFGLVIHGGAGKILKANMTPEQEAQYRADLETALQAGYDVLKNNGTAVEAVETAIQVLENSHLFNAGKGSVYTKDGHQEMDASIMDGETKNAGAVGAVRTLKNPISGARAVMDKSPHVLLIGKGAEDFCHDAGVETVDEGYFYDEKRYLQWKSIKEREQYEMQRGLDNQDGGDNGTETPEQPAEATTYDTKFGTVGAVALDRYGNLAAGTSTGGMTNKPPGRIGDSPIIGSGTYADNESCAVSCTGHGEYFMRVNVAHEMHAQVLYEGRSLDNAASDIIDNQVGNMGGKGGLIAINTEAEITWWYNTEGMYRGAVNSDGDIEVYLFAGED